VTQAFLQTLMGRTITVTLELAVPTLAVSLGVGLLVSVLQAVTQIQEMTLTFVPKVVAVAVIMLVAGPWMLNTLLTFTTSVYDQIPNMTASLR
jgi:flagellar biosynthetic protein FliQ